MCTDNPILLRNTRKTRPIICMQRKAKKIVPSEDDIVKANKLAFNDEIGKVTNNATSMFEVMAGFEPNSEEHIVLEYRIMCSQNYQQNTIDRAKGIIAKSMPEYWYRTSPNMPREGDSDEELKIKEFNLRIAAAKKPLFMIYVYPKLKKEYKDYIKSANQKLTMMYGALGINSIDDLRCYEPKTEEMKSFIYYYDELMPVGVNDCIVNRIARIFDREFEKIPTLKGEQPKFDTSVLKSGTPYSTYRYRLMSSLYTDFLGRTQEYERRCNKERISKEERWWERHRIIEYFKSQAYVICANKDELCDILVDMCYKAKTAKTFVWDMCEEELIAHLLDCNDGKIRFPQHVEKDGEFEYAGEQFVMKECEFPGFSRIRKVSWQ